ncbi:energy-coupling factor transporter transmembrane component T [Lacticaseibacillus hulanensis]|uniref:energy-coupling factor transporter transmembrane component T n=1 Tax=Lacticaseibacillus hulanensis TaxID=2493111 RepID=UPI000FD7E5E0|nr:energy-coupling factor transporter transmembrane component T [Lacticaseibacillus hulanensis]
MKTVHGHRDPFGEAHPLIQAAYFIIILGLTAFCLHPLALVAALIGAAIYGAILRGWRHVAKLLLTFILPGMVVFTLINMCFNHYGQTLLVTLNSGNSITLEAIVYGLVLAGVLACGLCWFVAINQLMTRDKIVYLCGRMLPAIGLLMSLTFRFVPLLGRQFRAVKNAQTGTGNAVGQVNWRQKFHVAANIFSIMTTWALETAVTTADSMRSRGYGTGHRTAYARFHFRTSDRILAAVLIVLTGLVLISWRMHGLFAQYNPQIIIGRNLWTLIGTLAVLGLALLPSIMYVWSRLHQVPDNAKAELPPYFARN